MENVEARVFCQCIEAGKGSKVDMNKLFDQLKDEYGGVVTLFVWKPYYNCWLDEKTSMTMEKKYFPHY